MNVTLYIIVPCYNEEECLRDSSEKLLKKLASLVSCGKASEKSRIVFVDDGSKDATWRIIRELHDACSAFTGVKLAANAGHQNAVMAGLDFSRGKADAAISIDADLQDDLDAMDGMLDAFANGADIVCGVRTNRETDSFLKRVTAEGYYKILSMLGGKIINNHADYRLLSARAVERLFLFPERQLFLRGLIPMLGYKTATVGYSRKERLLGTSKYTPFKMVTLAADGLTSLTVKPFHILICTGGAVTLAALLAVVVFIILAVCGLKSGLFWLLFSSVWLIGGATLASIGLVGLYAGKALIEVKARPRYFTEATLSGAEKGSNTNGDKAKQ